MHFVRGEKRFLIFQLLLMAPLAGVGVDLFVPSLPSIAQALKTSDTLVKWTISFYLFGYALGQPFFGSLSDSFGRKPLLIGGLGLYVISSFLISFSKTIDTMLLLRFFQGLFVATTGVLSKTMLTDAFLGPRLARLSTYMALTWALGPILAPVLGGYLETYLGWQSCFYFFTLYGLILLFFAVFFLEETNPNLTPLNFRTLLQNYYKGLTHKEFLGAILCLTISYSLIVVFNVVGPFFIQTVLGYSAVSYGHFALLMGLAFFIGSLINRFLIHRSSLSNLLLFANLYGLAVACLMLLASFFFPVELLTFILPIFFLLIAAGSLLPNSMASALSLFPKTAGTATAIMGSLFILGSALVSLLASFLETAHLIPISIAYIVLMLISVFGWLLTKMKTA